MKAEERDGLLFVEGLKEPLHRDGIRSIRIRATNLKFVRAFSNEDGQTLAKFHITGSAVLENCTVGVAGQNERVRDLSFTGIMTDNPDLDWEVCFGFIEANWEIGNDDDWFFQIYIPRSAFEELLATYKAGQADTLNISCNSDMWADSWVRWVPITEPINWKLAPGEYGPVLGRGTANGLTWQVVPKQQEADPKSSEAYKMGQNFADSLFDNLPATEQPTKKRKTFTGWVWAIGFGLLVAWAFSR